MINFEMLHKKMNKVARKKGFGQPLLKWQKTNTIKN